MKDYQGALENLDKVHVFKPNNTCNLNKCVDVKGMLKDYQKALQDLEKAHILEPNNVSIVTMHGDVKGTFKDYQITLEDFEKTTVFFNEIMQLLWTFVDISEGCWMIVKRKFVLPL